MKRLHPALAIFASVLFFTACSESENEPENQTTTSVDYVGSLSVNQLDGTFYVMDSVTVSLAANDTTPLMSLLMHQVRFSSRMPTTLDMTIHEITVQSVTSGYTLTGDSLVPVALGGPFPAYTITELYGTFNDSVMTLSMKCGNYPLTFEGKR